MSINDILERDLDTMFENLLHHKHYKTMEKCLEMCKPTYSKYEYYFSLYEEAMHKQKNEGAKQNEKTF